MFNFFKKKDKNEVLDVYSPTDGDLLQITEVKDDVFSTKMLGDGFAVKSENGNIYSPVDGTITTVFPTKHAIGVTTKEGLEILIHLGLDTVELKGAPFDVKVEKGQEIQHGTLLANMNLKMIQDKGYDDVVIIVYTNMDLIESVSSFTDKQVAHGDKIQDITFKEK